MSQEKQNIADSIRTRLLNLAKAQKGALSTSGLNAELDGDNKTVGSHRVTLLMSGNTHAVDLSM